MDGSIISGAWDGVCSLTCYKCFREFNNGTCHTAGETCIATHGQSCFRQKVIAEGKMLYIQKGCTVETDKCHYTEGSNGITMTTECCDTHDFCN
ncbi:hypothetical protein JRQ81_010872 [Phrynocephalus forsythii]|uniref:UPAR/Ly6 domain-containing protein n=1 Tax=Phrynocephalus forsythii TaxID=171643 RepID=A0A9Q0X7B1_9SAUR|nr:hypothetical protein JRQ81_010872 [Phrynocephalus forsythii]